MCGSGECLRKMQEDIGSKRRGNGGEGSKTKSSPIDFIKKVGDGVWGKLQSATVKGKKKQRNGKKKKV